MVYVSRSVVNFWDILGNEKVSKYILEGLIVKNKIPLVTIKLVPRGSNLFDQISLIKQKFVWSNTFPFDLGLKHIHMPSNLFDQTVFDHKSY